MEEKFIRYLLPLQRLLPSVIADNDFLKLWIAQFTSQIGLNALYFVLTVKVYELYSSNIAVSILILTFTVPSIFIGYIAGVYVDQLSLKKVMVITNFIRTVSLLLLIIFLNQTLLLFFLVFVLALSTVFFIPAEGSSIPALVPEKRLIAANSLFSLTLQTSLAIGFLAGGFSLRVLGDDLTLAIIFSLFLVSLIFNLWLPKDIRSKTTKEEYGILKRFIDGIYFVFTTKKVRDSIFFLTLTNTIIFVLVTIGPGFIDTVLSLDVKDLGAFIVLPSTIGMAFGSFILSYVGDRFNERRLINFGLFGLGLIFLQLSYVGRVESDLTAQVFSLVLIFLIGLTSALITIPTITQLQRNTPEDLRGRAYGLLGTFVSGFAALPVLMSGAIADRYGVRTVLVVLGGLVISFGLYRLRRKKVF